MPHVGLIRGGLIVKNELWHRGLVKGALIEGRGLNRGLAFYNIPRSIFISMVERFKGLISYEIGSSLSYEG